MNYDTCLKLKVIGLHQDRRTGSEYYITPDIVMNIEDVGSIKSPLGIMVDITPFVFIPKIEHVLDLLGRNFGEIRMMMLGDTEKQVCAYAREPLSEGVPTLRAFGSNVLEALSNLAIAIYEELNPPIQA